LNVAAACSFSLCAMVIVASSSITSTGRPSEASSGVPATIEAGNAVPVTSARCAQATSRAAERAPAIPARSASSIPSSTRRHVVSEATGPNTFGLINKGGDVADALSAIGDHHRDIGQYPARIVHCLRRHPAGEHRRQLPGQRRGIGQIGQQARPGVRHHTDTISRDFNGRTNTGSVHAEGAFLFEDPEPLTRSESPTGQALSLTYTPTPSLDLGKSGLVSCER
jgi:hypothetical protein